MFTDQLYQAKPKVFLRRNLSGYTNYKTPFLLPDSVMEEDGRMVLRPAEYQTPGKTTEIPPTFR